VLEEENALDISDLEVSGMDVMKALKIKESPKVGKVLNALLEQVLDDPGLNKRQSLLKIIRQYKD
jgi:poly(A) polymerase/tRNA nucleotidyltransferase (CCA-adding enzyme)